MRIRKLYIFMFRSFFGPFIMTFCIAIFVLLMQFLWKYIDDLVGKGLEWSIVAQLLFWASTTMIPLALPLAMLLSSIMTFGNLGEHYELVALKSAGISLQKIMLPLIITTIFISISAFYFSNNLLPYANLKMGSLLYDVREQKPALNIKEGIFYNGIEDYVIRVAKKEDDGKTIKNIMIYDHTQGMGNTSLTLAESGTMEMTADKRYLIFTLLNGRNYSDKVDGRASTNYHPFQRTTFKEEYRRFDLSGFSMTRTNEEFFKDNYQMMNVKQLTDARDSLKHKLDSAKVHFKEIMRNSLFYIGNFYKKDSVFKDTSLILTKSILQNSTKDEKTKIIEKAIYMARGTKDQIFYNSESFYLQEKFMARHDIERHRKYTLSIACLILFFIGAPLGAIIRKGGLGLPMVVSIVFFLIYHIVTFTSEKMVREDILDVFTGMWFPAMLFLPFGIFLTIKATSDSTLFDTNAYMNFFRKPFTRKKKSQITK